MERAIDGIKGLFADITEKITELANEISIMLEELKRKIDALLTKIKESIDLKKILKKFRPLEFNSVTYCEETSKMIEEVCKYSVKIIDHLDFDVRLDDNADYVLEAIWEWMDRLERVDYSLEHIDTSNGRRMKVPRKTRRMAVLRMKQLNAVIIGLSQLVWKSMTHKRAWIIMPILNRLSKVLDNTVTRVYKMMLKIHRPVGELTGYYWSERLPWTMRSPFKSMWKEAKWLLKIDINWRWRSKKKFNGRHYLPC
jgi:hypothetical protein